MRREKNKVYVKVGTGGLTILILVGLLLITGMMMGGCGDQQGDGQETGSSPESASTHEAEENELYQALDEMKIQIEEVLEEDPNSMLHADNGLEFDSILCGCFLEKDKETLLVRFDYVKSPHVAGVDRCIVAIFDTYSGDLITWKYLGGDEVELHVLPMDKEPDRLICIRSGIHQGQVTSCMELYQIEKNDWKQIELPEIEAAISEMTETTGSRNSLIEMDAKGRVLIFEEKIPEEPLAANNGEIQLHRAFMWSQSQKQYVEITPEDVYLMD